MVSDNVKKKMPLSPENYREGVSPSLKKGSWFDSHYYIRFKTIFQLFGFSRTYIGLKCILPYPGRQIAPFCPACLKEAKMQEGKER
jgi:hypothetical protein